MNPLPIVTLLVSLLSIGPSFSSDLTPYYLRCEYLVNPVIDEELPRLSWILQSDTRSQVQTSYQLLVASNPELLDEGKADLWDSEKVNSSQTNQVVYEGKPLQSGQICYWKVRSWDKDNEAGPWSDVATWEMGFLEESNWEAKWIGKDYTQETAPITFKEKELILPPSPLLRKTAQVKKQVKKARLYTTALGLFEFRINGKKVGEDYLSPGWTDYDKRVYYTVHNVKDYLVEGANVLQSELSYGWFSGYIGYALLVGNPTVRAFYGETPALKAELHITYSDGSQEKIITDSSWKLSKGGTLESDILHGETFDARKEPRGWEAPSFDDSGWDNVSIIEAGKRNLQVYPAQPVQVTDTLRPVSVTDRGNGRYIFDMGQNFAGVVSLKVKGEAGDKVVLRFGEMLHDDGSLMVENLRMARAIDTYILRGDQEQEEWTPKFTYHGFQYVEVTGYPGTPDKNSITGLVLGSNTPKAGHFETDHDMVNQLYSNIVWTQRANFVDIPTDCPQRDERLGWTGDAQIYGGTSTLNMDVSAFFTKWIQDLHDAQWEYGAYPDYAPAPPIRVTDTFAPGWMEAGVINPYEMYRAYGDTRIIEKGWKQMEKFMDFHAERSNGKYFYPEGSFADLHPKGGYGDWLSIGKKTPPDMLATFYYGYVASLMEEMARALGKSDRANHYGQVATKVREAFAVHYMDPSSSQFKTDETVYGDGDGYVDGQKGFSGHTQTAYANAIYKDFLKGEEKEKAGNFLAELVRENQGKLATGFLGVKQLLPALSTTGHSDIAYQLLLNTEYPSWGFEIENGATTIWERWDSYVKDDPEKMAGLNAGMNSFSHYAFGSVYEWMFRHMAGITADEPGYRRFSIKPELPDSEISYVHADHHSINGEISSTWIKKDKKLSLKVSIPVNTQAEVYVPTMDAQTLLLDGRSLSEIKEVEVGKFEDGYVSVKLGSGEYEFESAWE
ncbi:alpha-L-rhamnosidase [Pleomorphovibrio marinus]|uniref:alpha-L-rhamnosidase n=1 Tax=Pleomorphovibrio marinus TaxID=2164132 RepID=UPI000E0C82B6|nr:alpha-L-rhamnosidase [Pleomorphovibrio marinus]